MESIKLIGKRKSIRGYSSEKISEDDLKEIVLSASAAPIAMGEYDNYKVTVVKDTQFIEQMSAGSKAMMGVDFDPLYGAGVVVLLSSTEPMHPGTEFIGIGAMAQNMMLVAAELELGTCIIGAVPYVINNNEQYLKKLNLPSNFSVKCGFVLGVPKEKNLDTTVTSKIESNSI